MADTEYTYKGKSIDGLTRNQAIQLCKELLSELKMVGSTVPDDLKKNDAAEWVPPKRVAQLWRGKGDAGGR